MALVTHNITGTLKDADGNALTVGTVVFTPAATHDARVDGTDALLGFIIRDIASLPATLPISEGGWTIRIVTTAQTWSGTSQQPVFKAITVPLTVDRDYTWGEIVNGAVTNLPVTPTQVQQAADSAAQAAASATDAAASATAAATFDPALYVLKANVTANVKDAAYGAVGDGVADDTAAIQAAIDFVAGLGGGTVYLPIGTYSVTGLTLPDKVILVGDGPQSTSIRLRGAANTDVIKSADFDTLTGTNNATHPSFLGLRDLRVDGNDANNPTGGAGAKLYARAVFLDRVIITHCKGDGLYTEGPASGAGVSEWSNLPPGSVGWLTCIENGGNGWTHKGHSDMRVGFYHGLINTGHGLHMETVAGVTRSTMVAGELRISSNGVSSGSRGVNLVGSGTDLIAAVGRFENNGGAGIYAAANTVIRVGVAQMLQNCKVADTAQLVLNAAHRSAFPDLLVREPWLATTNGAEVINASRIRISGTIDGSTDPTGPAAGVANTGIGLKLQGASTVGGQFDVNLQNHNGAGASGLRTGDSAGILRNRVRASILNCTTAWWCVNAGVGNLYDITATVSAGQSTVGGGAAGLPGAGGNARVFGNDGTVQVYP